MFLFSHLLVILEVVSSLAHSGVALHSNLPRSSTNYGINRYQLWTPSAHVNQQGFLSRRYQRSSGPYDPRSCKTSLKRRPMCLIRQVPGDGNCLFHSISLCLRHAVNQTHWNMETDIQELYEYSRDLRRMAVDCLEDKQKNLYLQGRDWVKKCDLLDTTAQQYGLMGDEYCRTMRQDAVWGGGPEIVALCNVLRRPIHVYELCGEDCFSLQRMACFGSPAFDGEEALHILSADSRFPDLEPGKQMASGNHFMALFPLPKQQLRGGDFCGGPDDSVYRVRNGNARENGPFLHRIVRRCARWLGDLVG